MKPLLRRIIYKKRRKDLAEYCVSSPEFRANSRNSKKYMYAVKKWKVEIGLYESGGKLMKRLREYWTF
jgi:hypothetical protein